MRFSEELEGGGKGVHQERGERGEVENEEGIQAVETMKIRQSIIA